jgi:hypothetical protein
MVKKMKISSSARRIVASAILATGLAYPACDILLPVIRAQGIPGISRLHKSATFFVFLHQ